MIFLLLRMLRQIISLVFQFAFVAKIWAKHLLQLPISSTSIHCLIMRRKGSKNTKQVQERKRYRRRRYSIHLVQTIIVVFVVLVVSTCLYAWHYQTKRKKGKRHQRVKETICIPDVDKKENTPSDDRKRSSLVHNVDMEKEITRQIKPV